MSEASHRAHIVLAGRRFGDKRDPFSSAQVISLPLSSSSPGRRMREDQVSRHMHPRN
jgi:hypothetical protein